MCTLREKKKKYSNCRDIRKKNSERKKKHNPPCKLNGRSLSWIFIVLAHWNNRGAFNIVAAGLSYVEKSYWMETRASLAST